MGIFFQRVPQRGYKASGAALTVAAVGGAWVGVGVGYVVYVRFSHNRTLTAVVMVFPGRVVQTVMEVTSSPTYEFYIIQPQFFLVISRLSMLQNLPSKINGYR